ncbi:hypothetical protein HMPREF9144_2707 [Prevotella pallens ATCC 700821]|uniref:Uncharacterized protein n=1 Tax=Prevotella pallens ATCC 700821 TaxID=997353 RepID=F9DM15_9BACT|nr:hypothetical protein HMPREF9144_2707 [Prevotella pallens ATCC 700821]
MRHIAMLLFCGRCNAKTNFYVCLNAVYGNKKRILWHTNKRTNTVKITTYLL